jgi:nicotinate-nucleotide adenylyltransferase
LTRRVGIFGGAFDPPHQAHEALARCAVEQLKLDELRIFPTGQAWHKDRTTSPAEHRAAMAHLAFDGLPHVVVDERELSRPGPTYTVDTLAELAAENPGAELFLVIGADQAQAFDRWRAWQRILELATISIAGRAVGERAAGLFSPELPAEIAARARLAPLQMPPMDVSATAIRARIAAGLRADALLAPAVARYIDLHHLYQPH